MAYRLPPLASFRVFEAAARHLSFKKAAEELSVTPAAVSQQIKKLESYLGAPLFVRAAPKLHLTEEGAAMLPKVSEGLDLFAQAVESTQQSKQEGVSRALNVISPPSFAARWLVPRLARFSAAVPDLAIRIDVYKRQALITADHGNADEMYEIDKKTKQPAQHKDGSFKAKTAHTLNPVPLILYDNVTGGKLGLQQTETAGLSNIAATVANLLGLEKHAAWNESLLKIN